MIDYEIFVKTVYIPIIIAVFAIAFPLLLQTVSRIDEKYHSTRLMNVFYKEQISRIFIIALISSLVSIVIWYLKIPRKVDWGILNFIIDHSAFLIITITSFALILVLFLFVRLIKIYYNPIKLLKRLTEKYNKEKNEKKTNLFSTISDLLYYSIQQQNELLARELVMFLTEAFIVFRKDKEGEVIKYPNEYYDSIFEANELVCLRRKKTISNFNGSILLNLFIDGYQKTILSEETYSALWLCVRQSLDYGRDDIIMSYWKNAHQHYSFNLQSIYEERNTDFKITNQTEVTFRENERQRFLEFHYALGGLLVFSKKYNLLKRLMSFTNQQPPKYELVPETLVEVFQKYMQTKEEIRNPFLYEQRYSFPDVDGVNSGGIIRMWIKKYFAILFLRQYTLHDYYYGHTSLDLPNLPTSLSEMNSWKSELSYLKQIVTETLDNEDLLSGVDYKYMSKEWFNENNKQEPISLIDSMLQSVENKYEETKKNQKVSSLKKEEFNKNTKEILTNVFEDYSNISNKDIGDDDCKTFYINGSYQLMDKGGFADNQDISYLNSDSIVAQSVASNFKFFVTGTFLYFISKKYIFKPVDLFSAIERMNFDFDEIIIISFGVNLAFYNDNLNVDNLTKTDESFFFKNLKIIQFDAYINEPLRESIFIINKDELPELIYNDITQKEIEKYKLEKIENTHIFTNIVDLNKENDLRVELSENTNETDLTKKVLACIALNIEVKWKISSKGYQFKAFNQFIEKGNPNSFDNLEPLKKKEKPAHNKDSNAIAGSSVIETDNNKSNFWSKLKGWWS